MAKRIYKPTANEVECPTGAYVDMANPDPATITLLDIAHKLAQCNRWAGSAMYPYSVARHAIFCARYVEAQGGTAVDQLMALHHDDPEAFLQDIPRPLKPLFGAKYERLTRKLERAISEGLELPEQIGAESNHTLIKKADRYALMVEAYRLMPSQGKGWIEAQAGAWDLKGVKYPPVVPSYWRGEQAWSQDRIRFIRLHNSLERKVAKLNDSAD